MSLREKVIKAHRALLNGSGELYYFVERGITEQTVRKAYLGYDNGALLYPCRAKSGSVLGLHYKSKTRDAKGKRRQWWGGYADNLPQKGHGKKPDAPAKIIPFGMETLKLIEAGSQVVLCCGEEDTLSVRQAGYTSVSQPGAGLLEPVYAKEFADLEVVVFYDAGEEHETRKDALTLLDAGAVGVRVVKWPKDARHGDDINSRLVEDPEAFGEWMAGMLAGAEPLDFCGAEEDEGREGEPDTYADLPDPEPLPEGLPPVAPFDPDLLPEPFRGWITDISERMQVPPDFCAAGAVTVAGGLIGRKIGIHPKRYDDWLVVPNLWGALVGRSALLKSPALAESTKPLDRLAAEAYEHHKVEIRAYEAEMAA